MHYDAVTYAQKAIKDLQSEVKLFLKKNHNQEILPKIKQRSNSMNYQSPQTGRNFSHKSVSETPQRSATKQMKTIKANESEEKTVSIIILKPRTKYPPNKIILPRFEKGIRKARLKIKQNTELQSIESSLIEKTYHTLNIEAGNKQQQAVIQKIKAQKHSNSRINRYSNRTSLDQKLYIQVGRIQVQNQQFNNRCCFSPWAPEEEAQFPSFASFEAS